MYVPSPLIPNQCFRGSSFLHNGRAIFLPRLISLASSRTPPQYPSCICHCQIYKERKGEKKKKRKSIPNASRAKDEENCS